MFKAIRRFIWKTKQIRKLEKEIWGHQKEHSALNIWLSEANDNLDDINNKLKIENDYIERMKDTHKYEERQRVKEAKEKVESIERDILGQKAVIDNPKTGKGLKQAIGRSEAIIKGLEIYVSVLKDNKF